MATLPILVLFYTLAVKRLPGYRASIITVAAAVLLSVAGYRMPVSKAVLAAVFGAMNGLFPIGWLIVAAVFLFNITVRTGQFEVIKRSISGVASDRRLQVLLIAFCFSSLLEAPAGFGAPVAIAAAMLVGLGFNPVHAAGLALLANTAPVAYAAIGIPVITAGKITGLSISGISQMTARQLPLLGLITPLWLVWTMAGWRGTLEVLPAVLVTGTSFAVVLGLTANYLGPELPAMAASLAALASLVVFLKVWKPRRLWTFSGLNVSGVTETASASGVSTRDIVKAWSPFVILVIIISIWGIPAVKNTLDQVSIVFPIPGLHNLVIKGSPVADQPTPYAAVFTFNWLSSAGTATFLAAFITMALLRVTPAQGAAIFSDTIRQLAASLLTIAMMLAFAYIANYSGLSTTLGIAATVTGGFFPFFSPLLGWLGVFLTGSDTSSNALFGKLQQVTAEQLGIDPVLTVASNASGGVTGKMISPQSLAVGAAAVGLTGRESDLFRFTIKHSVLMAIILGILTYLQANVLSWMIP
ncbi:lactate permease [Clostridiales bacterium PH28_bin88]|nr:lactate permease [Clostridiales bacterium PH28_bin88]